MAGDPERTAPRIEFGEYEPYEPKLFIGRYGEIDKVRTRIEAGKANYPIPQPLINIWSPAPGRGRSWLLARLKESYYLSSESPAEEDQKLPFVVHIDFQERALSLGNPITTANFLGEMIEQIQSQLPESDPANSDLNGFVKEGKDFKEESGPSVEQLAGQFTQLVNQLSERSYVPLFLPDSAEALPDKIFLWLEAHVWEPILSTDRAVMVATGRDKCRPAWNELSVSTRRRLTHLQLEPFSLRETGDQLKPLGMAEKAREIYFYTGGSPWANSVIARAFQEGEEVASALEVVKKSFFPDTIIQDLAPSEVRDNLRAIFYNLTVLRKLGVESARYLLTRLMDERYDTLSDGDYLGLLDLLEDVFLMVYDSEKRGYVGVEERRRVINSLKMIQDPAGLAREYQIAFKFNQDSGGWVYPPTVLEMIYHSLNRFCLAPRVEGLDGKAILQETKREFSQKTLGEIPGERSVDYLLELSYGLAGEKESVPSLITLDGALRERLNGYYQELIDLVQEKIKALE